LGKLKNQILANVSGAIKQKIITFINNKKSEFNSSVDDIFTQFTTELESFLQDIMNQISAPLSNGIDKIANQFNQETHELLGNVNEATKKKLTKSIESFASKMHGVDLGPDNVKTLSAGEEKENANGVSGFTLTYKEYLKVFTLLGCFVNRDNLLKRVAAMVQVNTCGAGELLKNGHQYPPSNAFKITEAYTVMGVSAEVSVGKLFLSIPVVTGLDSEGNTTMIYDYSRLGQGQGLIRYNGRIGY
jgi:hypothetical protein